jgi:hypothetical protein
VPVVPRIVVRPYGPSPVKLLLFLTSEPLSTVMTGNPFYTPFASKFDGSLSVFAEER